MKRIISILVLLAVSLPALAADKTNRDAIRLIERIEKVRAARPLAETPLVKFMPSPVGGVEQGADYSVFITPVNSYSESNIILDGVMDLSTPVGLIHSSENLWIFHASGFSEQREHTLTISLSLENKQAAKQIRNGIEKLTNEINALNIKIDKENDPLKKAALIAQRDEKLAIRAELSRQLLALKTPIGTQDFRFSVVPAFDNENFPKLLSVEPQAGPMGGGTQITIKGKYFVDGMTVKLGGVQVSATFVDSETITATTSAFSQSGIKDLEVSFPPLEGSSEIRNSFLKNSFFATNSSLTNNVPPVALTGAHQAALVGSTVQLSGLSSFDPNGPGTTLGYAWKVFLAPQGANLIAGQSLDPVPTPSVTPSVAGLYIFELKVQEQNTGELLISEPSYATVEIQNPVNNAPVPSAPPITTNENTPGSTTVSPNDPDQNQSWVFAISAAPEHGSASIDRFGVVTYVPSNGFVGEDSIAVRVIDNGNPLKSGDYSISVTVNPVNHAPTATAPGITVASSGSGTSQISVVDQDPNDTHIFVVQVNGTKGNATVNFTSGLVSYTATSGASGSDSVTIRITDSGGLFVDLPIAVTINPNLPPNGGTPFFWINTKGSPVNVTVGLQGALDSDGTIVNVSHNFGDGTPEASTANGASSYTVSHDYKLPGIYVVNSVLTDNLGATTTISQTISVVDTEIPTAKFTANFFSGASPLSVLFDASAATGSIASYRWFWGDGSAEETGASLITPTHNYLADGVYTLRFRTRSTNRAQAQANAKIYVGGSAPFFGQLPVADFQPDARRVIVGAPMNFNGARSFDPDNPAAPLNYSWHFGTLSGSSTTDANPTVNFVAPINEFISLAVDDGAGGFHSKTMEVFGVLQGVEPTPVITASAISGFAPLTVNFSGVSSYDTDGTISDYLWYPSFGVGNPPPPPVSGSSMSYTYTEPNTYPAVLEVTDNHGNKTRVVQEITVLPAGVKRVSSPELSEEEKEERRLLLGSCTSGNGMACYLLAQKYESDGDSFKANAYKERACSLGYQAACAR